MLSYRELKKNFNTNKDFDDNLKVALLSTSAAVFLKDAIKVYFNSKAVDVSFYEGAFNAIDIETINEKGELYTFEPDYIIIDIRSDDIITKYYDYGINDKTKFKQRVLKDLTTYIERIKTNTNAKIVISNFLLIETGVFGNSLNDFSFEKIILDTNIAILNLIKEYDDVFMLDVFSLANKYGVNNCIDNVKKYIASNSYTMDFLTEIASQFYDTYKSLKGKIKKVLVLDLDNTLWGGVVGDDGVENIILDEKGIGKAYLDLQRYAKELSKRGVLIVIVSKNDEKIAKEPFEKNKKMILELDDISLFIANWEDKASNIKNASELLNLKLDSFVFIDDNPYERNIVRTMLKDVEVPEIPKDPCLVPAFISSKKYFSSLNFTKDDIKRTKMYKEEIIRKEHEKVEGIDDFLKTLEVKISFLEGVNINDEGIKRAAQLTQRTNQFNLRTQRYTEEDIKNFIKNKDYVFQFNAKDKYGDYGTVSIVILTNTNSGELFLDTFLMSCRVMKRGVEEAIFNFLIDYLKEKSITKIKGEYIKTAKNSMVENLLAEMSFVSDVLELEKYKQRKTFVKMSN